MHVLLIAHPNGWGGTENNSTLMVEALVRRGHQVDLWEFPAGGSGHYRRRWSSPIAEITEYDTREARGLAATGWWGRALRRLAPDLVVLAKGDAHACFPGLDLSARRLGLPLVVIEHHPVLTPAQLEGLGPLTFLREWQKAGYRRLQLQQRLAAARIAVSAINDRALNAYLRWTKSARTVIHPGIPFDLFQADPAGADRIRRGLGIPEGATVFGAIGRFDPNKRFELALRLFTGLKLPIPPWFLLVGGGAERPRLERALSELGIEGRVRLVDWVASEERPAYYSAIDCFLMLSELEGLGMTLVEAIACGCTCIATACGGPEEILTDPSLGVLIREGDWEAAQAAMLREATEVVGRRDPSQSEARRALVRKGFDADAQNERYAEYLEGVLARSRGSGPAA